MALKMTTISEDVNIISLFKHLSKNFLNLEESSHTTTQNEIYIKVVTKIAYDVMQRFRFQNDTPMEDFWYAEILVSDFGYELITKNYEEVGCLLLDSIHVLSNGSFTNLEEILKLLLLLKGPFNEENCLNTHPFTFSGRDFFVNNQKRFQLLPTKLFAIPTETPEGLQLVPSEKSFLDRYVERRKAPKRASFLSQPLLKYVDSAELHQKNIDSSIEDQKIFNGKLKESPNLSPLIDAYHGIFNIADYSFDLEKQEKQTQYAVTFAKDLKLSGPEGVKETRNSSKLLPELNLGIFLQDVVYKRLINRSMKTDLPFAVGMEHYVCEVKFLLCGVSCNLFLYDEDEQKFFMKVGTYIEGISPDCLFDCSKMFLETGTYFRKITTAYNHGVCNDYSLLFLAFWNSVGNFLQRHRDEVIAIPPDSTIMFLTTKTSKLYTAMAEVHRICCNKKSSVPLGGQLLTYLYDCWGSAQQGHVKNLILSLLYDCSAVYLSKLVDQWTFHGFLDSITEADFFVQINMELSCRRDRSCYLSVTAAESHIPIFLHSLASKILSCGKAVWLLKLFDPENPFIYLLDAMKNPKIRLCTTEAELSQMQLELSSYEQTVLNLCGNQVSYLTCLDWEFVEVEEREKKIRKMQLKKVASQKEPTECECVLFGEEKEDKQNRKIEKVQCETDVKLTDASLHNLVEERMNELAEEYTALAEEVEIAKNHAEWRIKRFQLQNRREVFAAQDVLNQNATLDEEGNVIGTELDVENANTLISPTNNKIKQRIPSEAYLNDERNKPKTFDVVSVDEINANGQHGPTLKGNLLRHADAVGGDSTQSTSQPYNINLDEKIPVSESEALRNRRKVLGSSLDCVELNVPTVAHPKILTDAERNKRNVLGIEFDISGHLSQPLLSSNVNSNMPKVAEIQHVMTEAQRNKLKVLGSEFDLLHVECSSNPLGDVAKKEKHFLGKAVCETLDCSTSVIESSPDDKSQNNALSSHKGININPVETPKLPSRSLFTLSDTSDKASFLSSLLTQDSCNKRSYLNLLDMSNFVRYVQKSISVAISVQERLASSAILKHLLINERLMTHLASLRCYFLLHDGEFSRNLTNGLFQSLARSSEPHHFFDSSSLSGILNEALIYTSINSQTNANNLSFQIVKMPAQLIHSAHDVLTPFQLSYKVNWPLNIIITDASLDRYRKVFHVLINLKRVHWTLNETFLVLKTQTKDNMLDGKRLMNSPEYTKLATYRHAMTLFIITLEEHICGNGLLEAWIIFIKQLQSVSDLEHLYQKHVAFVKDIFRRCFLVRASQDLLSYIDELIELGLKFHYVLMSSNWRLINEVHYSHPKYSGLKSIFNQFCKITKIFNKTLRKKTHHSEMKIHTSLLELIDMKIKV